GFFSFFSLMFFVVPIIFVVVFIIIAIKVCNVGSKAVGSFTLEAPSFVIPDQHREGQRTDGSHIKTVRLPEKCPSCSAALSHEGIDWVGPLEAQCTYCGGTVRATFESI
ncbi:MAG: hypothetical protein ACW99V_04120, partial [Candidatus Thorarchaeota archaeon]